MFSHLLPSVVHLFSEEVWKSWKVDAYWTGGVYTDDQVWVWESSHSKVGYDSWCVNQPNATITMNLACPMKRKMKKMMKMNKLRMMWKSMMSKEEPMGGEMDMDKGIG